MRSGFTSMTTVPLASANSGSPAAGYTIDEVPTTITRSAVVTASTDRCHATSGSASPNHTTLGRINPPHACRGGSTDATGSGIAGSSPRYSRWQRSQRNSNKLPCR